MTGRAYTRNVTVLATCQALFFMANTIVITVTALVGLQYAPTPALASLALGLQFIGTMAATLPASFLMQRCGRRLGFELGSLLGIAAGIVGWDAILRGSFAQFCLASVLYGVFGAFGQFYRFAAADAANAVADDAVTAARMRSRAIGWVMAGGTVAALLGPLLARVTRDLWAPVAFAGCFAAIAVLAGLIGLAVSWLDPLRPQVLSGAAPGRPLLAIARQPASVIAFLAALVAYVMMSLLMTATPLAMVACGFGFGETATVIQWHVLGMFAPSFATGYLIARLGPLRLILAGIGLMAACLSVTLLGIDLIHFALGLLLLGLGWNFMFIGATTLLTACHTEVEKAKVQGFNDFLVFTTVGISASAAGALHHLLGWQTLNLLAIPGLALVAAIVLFRVGVRPAPTGLPPDGVRPPA